MTKDEGISPPEIVRREMSKPLGQRPTVGELWAMIFGSKDQICESCEFGYGCSAQFQTCTCINPEAVNHFGHKLHPHHWCARWQPRL